MIGHSGPPLNMFDIVKHDPCTLIYVPTCICFKRSTPLASPCVDNLNKYTLFDPHLRKSLSYMKSCRNPLFNSRMLLM